MAQAVALREGVASELCVTLSVADWLLLCEGLGVALSVPVMDRLPEAVKQPLAVKLTVEVPLAQKEAVAEAVALGEPPPPLARTSVGVSVGE